MLIQFLLFLMTILLISIFWVLSKIHSQLKKDSKYQKAFDYETAKKGYGQSPAS